FQVFDKPTYIPLEQLTLLFGPNSAGKSAVQDAIELYAVLMSRDDRNSWQSNDRAKELLERHWRRSGGDDDLWVDRLKLGVIHTMQCGLQDCLELIGRKTEEFIPAANGDSWEIECRWNFERDDDPDESLSFTTCFEYFFESALVVRASPRELIVNLMHPLLSQTELKVDFAEVAKTYPDDVKLQDGHLTIFGYFQGFHPMGPGTNEHEDRWMQYYKPSTGGTAPHASDDSASLFVAALTELNFLLGFILRTANGNSRFKPTVVHASRNVPTRSDLIFQLGHMDDQIEPLLTQANKTYLRLAASMARIEIPFELWSIGDTDDLGSFGERINQALSSHLFIEQGYRIDHDLRVLMSKNNSLAAMAGEQLDPNEFGYVVELFLRDGQGRKHLFEDVGSGIGYVLPVLCAVFGGGGWLAPTTCFIQQPELHLHPALQAAMGDVFIEASAANKQILIETHSEHLLLRILKRIRQTHLQAAIAPELNINADDVCVLYFDPSPDGTTTVKRLRITEDGEFMDRWPRGFFAERDQELLDE
ncbi:MAG: DUF3696 domain-containing protein, partial [Rhodoferax sp.]